MEKYTAYNLVRAVSALPRNRNYNYINPKTHALIHIENVDFPAGPIQIRRWNPDRQETYVNARTESISSEMIWRVANAVNPGEPVNLDRILGASYNTRSVLETLMALTPEFYYCYPGRIKDIDGRSSIEHGHKHLIWLPNEPHKQGVLEEKQVPNMAVSEIPSKSVTYDNLMLPDTMTVGGDMDIDVVRRHTNTDCLVSHRLAIRLPDMDCPERQRHHLQRQAVNPAAGNYSRFGRGKYYCRLSGCGIVRPLY